MKEEILSIVTHALMGVEVSGETVDLIVNQVMKAIYDERPVLKNIEELENKLRVAKAELVEVKHELSLAMSQYNAISAEKGGEDVL